MPAGKRQQSSTVLYTLILFVGLFIVASVGAVVFYTKSEDYRVRLQDLERTTNDLASASERARLNAIVGANSKGSYLSTLGYYNDKTTAMVLGTPASTSSAEIKFDQVVLKVASAIDTAQKYITLERIDPNTGLVPVVGKLSLELDKIKRSNTQLRDELSKVQQKFEAAVGQLQETEQALTKEKDYYYQQSATVASDYQSLEEQRDQAADDRVQTVMEQLNNERTTARKLNQDLLRTQAELDLTQDKMAATKEKIEKIIPDPNRELLAYQPDGKILLVDDAAGVVHINIGSDSRVYKGLTFSVYDTSTPIQNNPAGKAEIEVYELTPKFSVARIVKSDPRNPVTTNDLVANLVWDAAKPKVFVLCGEFDLNKDGMADMDAVQRISDLIGRWGGKVAENVSVDTDFVIAGRVPHVPEKPTLEDLEMDPLAQEKHDAAQVRLARYNRVKDLATSLMVPVFTYNNFLSLIGYNTQVSKAGAF